MLALLLAARPRAERAGRGVPSASTRASPWPPVAFPGLQATEPRTPLCGRPWRRRQRHPSHKAGMRYQGSCQSDAECDDLHRFVSRRIGARTLERGRYAGRAVGLRECQKPATWQRRTNVWHRLASPAQGCPLKLSAMAAGPDRVKVRSAEGRPAYAVSVVAPQQTFQSCGTLQQIIGAGEQAQSTAVP
jgi:hypothetical protein